MKKNIYKAKKISTYKDKHFTTCVFEYRGKTYDVTYANGWQICCSPAWVQHRDNQAEIDEIIDNPKPVTKAEPFEKQIDEAWEMLGFND